MGTPAAGHNSPKYAWHPALRGRELWNSPERRPTVLFNALSLTQGGGLTVLRNYWKCFARRRPDWRFVILLGPFEEDLSQELAPNFRLVDCAAVTGNLVRRFRWERRWLGRACRQLDADIYFGPNGAYQWNVDLPQCLLVQDPGPFVLTRWNARDVVRTFLLKRRWRAGVRRAACMGYTSKYMRGLVIADAGGRTERRHLIAYNGIDEDLRARAQQPSQPRQQREAVILSVSTYMLHKNYETLVRALALLRRRGGCEHFRLRTMGRSIRSEPYLDFLRRESRRLGIEHAVRLDVDRPWPEIAAAYASAGLFSLTSLCESFGIPALEAMSYGTPVVVGDCCAVPEVCGDAALYVSPRDPRAVADAWQRVLTDEALYARMQEAGRRRCLEFSWEKTVTQWIEVMEAILAEPRPARAGGQ